jgi:hypothetical protein
MAALALSAASCSSDKKNPLDPGAAESAAQAGDAALANGDLSGADSHYKSALDKDPGNGHANLGAAITNLALLQDDAAVDSLLTFLDSVPLPLPAPGARAARSNRVLAHIGLRTGTKYDPITNAHRLARLMMRSTVDPIMASWYQRVIRNHIMPRLAYAEDRLTVIVQHPTFTYLVPTSITGLDFPLEVDLGEALALDAVVNSLQGVFGTLLAYNFDAVPGATNAELLDPASTFGTLNTGGAAILTAAQADLRKASARVVQMDAFIRAETDPQDDDAIPVSALDTQEFQDFEAGFAKMEAALTGTISVAVETWDSRSVDVTLSAGTFFTSPITDWKTMMPTHTIDACDQVIITNSITFPHPTFNGVLPSMTNPGWQDIIGTVNNPACVPVRPF